MSEAKSVDYILEDDYKFLLLNIQDSIEILNIEHHEFVQIDPIIEACLMSCGCKGYNQYTYKAIQILHSFTDNKYALALLAVVRYKYTSDFKDIVTTDALSSAFKALDLGCTEIIPFIARLFFENNVPLMIDADSSLYKHILKFISTTDNDLIMEWIAANNKLHKNILGYSNASKAHSLFLNLIIEKNKQIEQLKLQHEKEIEELLRPGNAGALAAEQRFIENAESL